MATTEEMNKVIHDYYISGIEEDFKKHFEPLQYNLSWDAIMCVWDKLRHEYDKLPKTPLQFSVFMARNEDAVKKSIVDVNITEAQRLIYEAITWLNQNKPK